ncbi:DUF5655 domain-containing protein [Microlunatus sp. GCM10028923]|uniref:DUF5655 domain-containing protein n=1 Tax=Microlunatus sp. GCM10028923 TaxID=3273400 RepID=UPI00361F23AC
MARWICPRCDREFAATGQGHSCVPGSTVEESLAPAAPWMRDCYAMIIEEVRQHGPVHEDAVRVGVFLKTERKLAEFRPRARTVRLTLYLPGQVEHPTLISAEPAAARVMHHFTLRSADDLDDELLGLVGLAYDFASEDSG